MQDVTITYGNQTKLYNIVTKHETHFFYVKLISQPKANASHCQSVVADDIRIKIFKKKKQSLPSRDLK